MTNATPLTRTEIPTRAVTPENFAPYGQVLTVESTGTAMTAAEAALDLSHGTPRFYLMRLRGGNFTFTGITRHVEVTQCLASVGGAPWFMAVAAGRTGQSAATDPAMDEIAGFEVPGDVALLLYRGTWHAGPYFAAETQAFFNLELATTNVDDHETSRLDQRFGVECHLTGPPQP